MNNKYQEALTRMKGKQQYDWYGNCVGYIDNTMGFEEEFKTLQELVDKETPMKVVKWEISKPITRCPECGAGVEKKDSYCWNCGQKLDWSEE